MKRLLAVLILSALPAFASYSVTGKALDGHGNAIDGTANNIYVQFDLMGCNGNTPRQVGTGTVVDQHPRFQFDASGNVTNSDGTAATILGNNEIQCPSGYYPTQWHVTWLLNNATTFSANYTINGAFDLNSAVPNTTVPVVTPPTGDGTYARLDGGNMPFTGSLLSKAITSISNGTFLNSAFSYGVLSNVGGGDAGAIFHSSQGAGNYSSDAVTGVITVPVGATVYQSNAISGLAVDNSGVSNTVALYGYAQCNVPNGKCWGANPAVQAAAGAANSNIQGAEVDVNINTGATGVTARGINVSMPVAHEAPGISQAYSCNAGNLEGVVWDTCYTTQPGASVDAFNADVLVDLPNEPSTFYRMWFKDSGGARHSATMNLSNTGSIYLTPYTGQNVVVTAGSLGFGTSNVPFITSDGVGGLKLIPITNENVTITQGSLGFGTSNISFVSPDGAGGVRLIPIAGQSTTFKNGTGGSVVAIVDSAGKGTFNGGIQPAATGTAITWFQKATHAALDLPSVASGACSPATTETISGAALGDSCSVSSAIGTADGSFYVCNVTASNTVSWSYCNMSGAPYDRGSDNYTIRVTR